MEVVADDAKDGSAEVLLFTNNHDAFDEPTDGVTRTLLPRVLPTLLLLLLPPWWGG